MPALSPWFLSFGGRAASEPFPLGSSLFQEGLVMRVPAFIEFTIIFFFFKKEGSGVMEGSVEDAV